MATVALACIYFERLCLVGVVTKPNRRLVMAACLAIAYKFNEAVLEGVSKLPALWAFVDHEWQVGGLLASRLKAVALAAAAVMECIAGRDLNCMELEHTFAESDLCGTPLVQLPHSGKYGACMRVDIMF